MEGSFEESDQSMHRSQLDHIIDVARQDKGELLLLVGIGAVILIGFRETRALTLEESRYVPEIILGMMSVILVITLAMKFFGEGIKDRLGISDVDPSYDLGPDEDAVDEDEQLFDIRPLFVSIHFGWLVAYLLSLNYIGFWTTNIAFTIIYIMVNDTAPLPRRAVYTIGWTILIVGTLWILFVELLVVTAIWRLGFLP